MRCKVQDSKSLVSNEGLKEERGETVSRTVGQCDDCQLITERLVHHSESVRVGGYEERKNSLRNTFEPPIIKLSTVSHPFSVPPSTNDFDDDVHTKREASPSRDAQVVVPTITVCPLTSFRVTTDAVKILKGSLRMTGR